VSFTAQGTPNLRPIALLARAKATTVKSSAKQAKIDI
jgi:hypothetical protein